MLTIFIMLLLIGLMLIATAWQKRIPRLRYLAARLLVTYLTLVGLLVGGEAYFRYLYAESGWGFTLAYQNWERRYWQTNSLGYRDREWTPQDWEGKTTIMVLGDSFSAGWGIEDPSDRYPDVLAELLGDDYAVINLARPGLTPRRELALAQEHPLQNPDIILFQYYLNDIDDAAMEIADFWMPTFPKPPHWIDTESYLANFLYWRIVPAYSTIHAPDGQSYWEWNYATFDNYGIFQRHRAELEQVMAFAEERNARLIVVIFPNMHDPVRSIQYVDAVATVFQEKGYTDILKLFDEAAKWDFADSMVSDRDAHPSVAFHHRVAELIYENFFAE
jgi:hypothetical protein